MRKQAVAAASAAAAPTNDIGKNVTLELDILKKKSISVNTTSDSSTNNISNMNHENVKQIKNTICLLQFVTPEDIIDEDEYNEIISNVHDIFSPFGELENISIKTQNKSQISGYRNPVNPGLVIGSGIAVVENDFIEGI